MNSSHDGISSDERGTSSMNSNDKKIYHRHSNHQIQRLESYFKECPHPDDLQRRKLGEELNLKPKQIKFWFQNKRTQTKAQSERADNSALRAENMKIRCENEAIQEALKNVLCPPCGGPLPGKEERERNLQKLRSENAFLKEQYEKVSAFVSQHGGPAIASLESLAYPYAPPPYGSSSNNPHVSYGTSSNHMVEPPRGPYSGEPINITQPPQPLDMHHFEPLSQVDMMKISEMAMKAVAEVLRLIQIDDPMWIHSSIDGRLVIDQDSYDKFFTKISHFKSPSTRIESSKEVVVVPMDATTLVDMFLDTDKWGRLFSTIVNETKTIHVLESMEGQRQNFTKLMYEQLHILSPLVAPREFIILRCCQQLEENLWVIADVSCDLLNIEFEFAAPTCSKRPSGCLIQALPHGRSQVTWMEHVEVNDKVRTHRLYRDLLCGGSGYGARRWAVTLERMCERLSLTSLSLFPPTDYPGAVKTVEGRMNVMRLGERMLKDFAWILKMSGKLDFSQLSETNNSGVRVSVRINTDPGQPLGLIVCAGSSLCLPIPPLQVYNFLTSNEVRHQWDVLCHGNRVADVARFVTGVDQNNCVRILQPTSEMMIIQEGFIDTLGGMVVYSPVDLNTADSATLGQADPSGIPVLPSGFIISRDATRPSEDGRDYCTTLLTVAFQIVVNVNGPTYGRDLNMEESTATVNTLVSSTIQRIKNMLHCDDTTAQ